jgi:hypothetical protein
VIDHGFVANNVKALAIAVEYGQQGMINHFMNNSGGQTLQQALIYTTQHNQIRAIAPLIQMCKAYYGDHLVVLINYFNRGIQTAIKQGYDDIAFIYIEHVDEGIYINLTLDLAVQYNCSKVVSELLKHPIDYVEARLILHIAAMYNNNVEIIIQLLNRFTYEKVDLIASFMMLIERLGVISGFYMIDTILNNVPATIDREGIRASLFSQLINN